MHDVVTAGVVRLSALCICWGRRGSVAVLYTVRGHGVDRIAVSCRVLYEVWYQPRVEVDQEVLEMGRMSMNK
jgi:hypothetical protein